MLKIGWSKCSTVPDKPVMLMGQMHVRISEGVADPLTVTALALDSGDEAAIFLGYDLCFINADLQAATRARLAKKLPGFDPLRLVMHATHSHTGPTYTPDTYHEPDGVDIMHPLEVLAFLADRGAEAAAAAWSRRAAGAVARGFGHAVVGHNRRACYLDGTALMYGETNTPAFSHIEGFEDHGVDLLYTFDGKGHLTGVIVNLACPSQETEGDMTISADFWHEVRMELHRRFGKGVALLPQCSFAGDQSPHLLLNKKEEAYMLERRGLSRRQEIARRIANAVEEVHAVVKDTAVFDAPLKHHVEMLQLPGRIITEADYQYALAELQTVLDRDPKVNWAQRRLRTMIAEYEAGGVKPPVTIELHVVRLGDVVFATSPSETYLDYASRIKARSRAGQTFLIQLACGVEAYLPSAKAVAKHYGGLAADNKIGPEGGQILVERTLKIIEELDWTSPAELQEHHVKRPAVRTKRKPKQRRLSRLAAVPKPRQPRRRSAR